MKVFAGNIMRCKSALMCLTLIIGCGFTSIAHGKTLSRFWQIEVTPQQSQAFLSGMHVWLKCLRAHGSKRTFWVWKRETGREGVYILESNSAIWSSFDKSGPLAGSCGSSYRGNVIPYIMKLSSWLSLDEPLLSYLPKVRAKMPALLDLVSYRVKLDRSKEFKSFLSALTKAAAIVKLDCFWETKEFIDSGRFKPNFVILYPANSWSTFAARRCYSINLIGQTVFGNSASIAGNTTFDDAIMKSWSNVYSYARMLSYTPRK